MPSLIKLHTTEHFELDNRSQIKHHNNVYNSSTKNKDRSRHFNKWGQSHIIINTSYFINLIITTLFLYKVNSFGLLINAIRTLVIILLSFIVCFRVMNGLNGDNNTI